MKTFFNLIIAIASTCLFVRCDNYDVILTSENIPLASANEIKTWELTSETLLGIRAFDPTKGELSTMEQHTALTTDVFGGVPFYKPIFNALSKEKQNIGGTLNRYHSHGEDNNSNDINLWMILFEEYQQFYDIVEFNKNDGWLFPTTLNGPELSCGDYDKNVPFLLGEIAVPNSFIDNNFFFRRADNTYCESGIYLHKLDTFGMYGAITTDRHHGNVPEVHPAQQFWFRNKTVSAKNVEGYWLFFVQDASDRFVDWIGSPLHGQYKIAFRYKPNKIKAHTLGPLTMDISLGLKEDMVTDKFPDQYADCDNGRTHALVVDGKRIVSVTESGFNDNDMGIQFVDVRKLSDGTIQGYVQVSMVIGDVETDAFGMGILSLTIKQPQSTLVNQPTGDLPVKENTKTKD